MGLYSVLWGKYKENQEKEEDIPEPTKNTAEAAAAIDLEMQKTPLPPQH